MYLWSDPLHHGVKRVKYLLHVLFTSQPYGITFFFFFAVCFAGTIDQDDDYTFSYRFYFPFLGIINCIAFSFLFDQNVKTMYICVISIKPMFCLLINSCNNIITCILVFILFISEFVLIHYFNYLFITWLEFKFQVTNLLFMHLFYSCLNLP